MTDPPIRRKRVRELAEGGGAEDDGAIVWVRPDGSVVGPEPSGELAADLGRAAARVKACRAAHDASLYQFRWDTAGHITSPDPDDAAGELEAALREFCRLAGRYWTETFHSGRKRSGRSVSARVAVLMAAYSEVVAACPRFIDHIRGGAPGFADSLEWLQKLSELASTPLNKRTDAV